MSDSKEITPVYFSKYTPDTYYGRFMTFLTRTNPLFMFITDKQLKSHQEVVEVAKKNDWDLLKQKNITQDDVYKSAAIVDALIHPQTGQPMTRAGTFPYFVLLNLPIITGMLLAPPTFGNNVFWQWINQTYNAFFNTTNANKIIDENEEKKSFFAKNQDFIMGYSGAVIVSVSLAVGLNHWLKISKLSKAMKATLQVIVPYTAVASAGVSNVALMRFNELITGVPVYTPDGTYVGTSKEAAKLGVGLSAFSRAVLPMPLLLVPPIIAIQLLKFGFIRNNKTIKLITDVATVAFCLEFGLPFATALFPQQFSMKFSKLEPHIQKQYQSNPSNLPLTHVLFNKGV